MGKIMHHLRLTFHRQPSTPHWCKIGVLGHFAKMAPREKKRTTMAEQKQTFLGIHVAPRHLLQFHPLQASIGHCNLVTPVFPARIPPKVIEVRILTLPIHYHYTTCNHESCVSDLSSCCHLGSCDTSQATRFHNLQYCYWYSYWATTAYHEKYKAQQGPSICHR